MLSLLHVDRTMLSPDLAKNKFHDIASARQCVQPGLLLLLSTHFRIAILPSKSFPYLLVKWPRWQCSAVVTCNEVVELYACLSWECQLVVVSGQIAKQGAKPEQCCHLVSISPVSSDMSVSCQCQQGRTPARQSTQLAALPQSARKEQLCDNTLVRPPGGSKARNSCVNRT